MAEQQRDFLGFPATTEPTASENPIEAIQLLHSLCHPAAEIARRLYVDQATVLHAIEHGALPRRQMTMLWRDELPYDLAPLAARVQAYSPSGSGSACRGRRTPPKGRSLPMTEQREHMSSSLGHVTELARKTLGLWIPDHVITQFDDTSRNY